MMKKFNLKKWQSLQERRADLYRKLHAVGNDRDFERERFEKQKGRILHTHDVARDRPIEKIIIVDRKLTYDATLERLATMRTNWSSICGEFSRKKETLLLRPLIELYEKMAELKKLEQDYDRVYIEVNNLGRGWNVLEEFASQQIKINVPAFQAATEPGVPVAPAAPYPIA